MNDCCENTDKQIWKSSPDPDGCFPDASIHVTKDDGIGINYGGHVIVARAKQWHRAGELFLCVNPELSSWRWKLGMWLLKADKPVIFPKL